MLEHGSWCSSALESCQQPSTFSLSRSLSLSDGEKCRWKIRKVADGKKRSRVTMKSHDLHYLPSRKKQTTNVIPSKSSFRRRRSSRRLPEAVTRMSHKSTHYSEVATRLLADENQANRASLSTVQPGESVGSRKTKAHWRVITPNVEMNPDVPKIGLCDVARSRDAIRKWGLRRLRPS